MTGDGKQPIAASNEPTMQEVIAYLSHNPVGIRTSSNCPSLEFLIESIYINATTLFQIPACPSLPSNWMNNQAGNEENYAWLMLRHLLRHSKSIGWKANTNAHLEDEEGDEVPDALSSIVGRRACKGPRRLFVWAKAP